MKMMPVSTGTPRPPGDEVRRYRPVNMNFDLRARLLSDIPSDSWDPEIREQHWENLRSAQARLIFEYGQADREQKLRNFIDLDVGPVSILSVHNALLSQARDAFVIGAYYPALVGAAALGERILNELILTLRDKYFSSHPASHGVLGKKSIDDWSKAIKTLRNWDVFSPDVASKYERLRVIRHKSVHFAVQGLHESGARTEALDAVRLLQDIVTELFPAMPPSPHFIEGTAGEFYLRRAAENDPLVQEFFIPASVLVSRQHEYRNFAEPGMFVVDNVEFEADHGMTTLTDAEFAAWQPKTQ